MAGLSVIHHASGLDSLMVQGEMEMDRQRWRESAWSGEGGRCRRGRRKREEEQGMCSSISQRRLLTWQLQDSFLLAATPYIYCRCFGTRLCVHTWRLQLSVKVRAHPLSTHRMM